jgi:hypothetical protein
MAYRFTFYWKPCNVVHPKEQTEVTLQQRIKTWQDAALHHSLPYYGLSIKIENFLIAKNLQVVKSRAIQTRLMTPRGTSILVTYKRGLTGKQIELLINGTYHYFGPTDYGPICKLLAPL